MPIVAKLGNYKRFMLLISAGTICMAIAYAILLAGNPWIGFAIFYTFMITLSEIFAMPFMISRVVQTATPQTRGSYLAVYTIAWALAFIVSPYSSTQIIEQLNYAALWWIMGAFCIAIAYGFYVLGKNKKVEATA